MDNLNEAQRKAVEAPIHVQLQILAGPGTGKTKTLTSRIANLIKNGAKPQELVVMTFTNNAASEMKQRVLSLVNNDSALSGLQIGTFHSVCFLYLRKYGSRIGLSSKLTVCSEQDKTAILKEVVRSSQFQTALASRGFIRLAEDRFSKGGIAFKLHFPSISNVISGLKNGVVEEDKSRNSCSRELYEFTQILYPLYCEELLLYGKLDFDDILVSCQQLLTEHPQIVDGVKHVLIDEFQDSNKVQLELARLFAQKYRSITVVGDPDQSIYSFRHARPQNLSKMKVYFPDTQTIYLEENYRSIQSILDLSMALIRQNANRLGADRKLLGYKKYSRKVPVIAFRKPDAEAKAVAGSILNLKRQSNGLFMFKDFAIICRTNRYMKELEMQFNVHSIPYRTLGGIKYWDRQEISLLIDYLRVVCADNEKLAIARTLTNPKRGIGQVSLDNLLTRPNDGNYMLQLQNIVDDPEIAKKFNVGPAICNKLKDYLLFINECRKLYHENGVENTESIIAVVDFILEKLQLINYLSTDSINQSSREANVEFFKSFVADLDSVLDNTLVDDESNDVDDDNNNNSKLELLLASISLDSKREKNGDNDVVTISTIHSAKGLEWPIVYMVNCSDPAISRESITEDERDEVCRTLFVAITRAKCLLFISYPREIHIHANELSSHLGHSSLQNLLQYQSSIPRLTQVDFDMIAQFLKRAFKPLSVASSSVSLIAATQYNSFKTALELVTPKPSTKKVVPKEKSINTDQLKINMKPVRSSNSINHNQDNAHGVRKEQVSNRITESNRLPRKLNENHIDSLAFNNRHYKLRRLKRSAFIVSNSGHSVNSAFKKPRKLDSL